MQILWKATFCKRYTLNTSHEKWHHTKVICFEGIIEERDTHPPSHPLYVIGFRRNSVLADCDVLNYKIGLLSLGLGYGFVLLYLLVSRSAGHYASPAAGEFDRLLSVRVRTTTVRG